jgi:aspartyl-tRNA(Asn)/glutamyl-tRNA(Gln) amidotransferase subunit B
MATTYTPTIGLEIHAELATRSKMFCGCKNAPHETKPNTHICPICMGHPGTLPAINKEAVRLVLTVGRALLGTLADLSEFDRKNYFYPDIPKGYQISQYAYPLVSGGSLADVAITRVHLEEDTARSLHDKSAGSLIDFNRAGVPLMELVTEPVMHDAKIAANFARELQLLLRSLGVSDANMEKGQMRVEANISISDSDTLGTKVEIKNLNSFKSVEAAIAHEVKRQAEALGKGEKVVQETRGWDEIKQVTVSQRKKESSHDYRYFPDPDLPKLALSEMVEFSKSRLDEMMPETPSSVRIKLENLGLPINIIETLVQNSEAMDFYMMSLAELEILKPDLGDEDRRKLANYITSDLLGYIAGQKEKHLSDASPKAFGKIISMLTSGRITSRVAKDLLPEVFRDADVEARMSKRGLFRQSEENIGSRVDAVLAEHSDVVRDYKAGKEASLQFLIGQCMKVTKGTADPALLKKLLIEKIQHTP